MPTPRSIWTGSIAFGLANVPCKLYTAQTERRIKFNQLSSETGNRIRQRRVDGGTGEEVEFEKIVRGYELSPDRYVTVSDEELEAMSPVKTKTIGLEMFVDPEEIPILAYLKPYFLGPNTGGGRAYSLLYDAMRETGKVGVGKIIIRSVERPCVIAPLDGGTIACCTLMYADEVNKHDDLGVESAGEASPAERDMAIQLVTALTGSFDFEDLKDTYRDEVMALIEAKAAGEDPPEIEERPQVEPVDMLKALEASLEAVRQGQQIKIPA